MNTNAIRQHASQVVRQYEKIKQTPSALIRWTIPALCDRVDTLEAERDELRAEVERLRVWAERWKETSEASEAAFATAEAKLERVEKLRVEWANRWDIPEAGRFDPNAKVYRMAATALRSVLADAPYLAGDGQ
jgi:predicted nuclease with TOPRIM domain